jgi:hypothetical protein
MTRGFIGDICVEVVADSNYGSGDGASVRLVRMDGQLWGDAGGSSGSVSDQSWLRRVIAEILVLAVVTGQSPDCCQRQGYPLLQR